MIHCRPSRCLLALLLTTCGSAFGKDFVVPDRDGSAWTISVSTGPRRLAPGDDGASRPVPEPVAAGEIVSLVSLPEPTVPAPSRGGAATPTPAVPAPPSPHLVTDGNEPGMLVVPMNVAEPTPRINGLTYRGAYQSVPYSYTEYLANPAYRHEAAMEILFGQMRPMTINKQYTPQVVPDPVVSNYRPFLFAHPEQWIYRYSDYRYQWHLSPQHFAPYGPFGL